MTHASYLQYTMSCSDDPTITCQHNTWKTSPDASTQHPPQVTMRPSPVHWTQSWSTREKHSDYVHQVPRWIRRLASHGFVTPQHSLIKPQKYGPPQICLISNRLRWRGNTFLMYLRNAHTVPQHTSAITLGPDPPKQLYYSLTQTTRMFTIS